jgi:hypothetical protein
MGEEEGRKREREGRKKSAVSGITNIEKLQIVKAGPKLLSLSV